MAGRPMNKLHQADVRLKIQASQLINVLQNHALGETEELSPSRIKAIEILLRKSIPDLTAVTLENDTDDAGNKIGFSIIHRTIIEPVK
jgi:hypothetical protein